MTCNPDRPNRQRGVAVQPERSAFGPLRGSHADAAAGPVHVVGTCPSPSRDDERTTVRRALPRGDRCVRRLAGTSACAPLCDAVPDRSSPTSGAQLDRATSATLRLARDEAPVRLGAYGTCSRRRTLVLRADVLTPASTATSSPGRT